MQAERSIVGALFALAVSAPASAAIREEPVSYKDGDTAMKGFVVYDDATKARRPGIVVVHEWWGITKHVHDSARSLAAMGYTDVIIRHLVDDQLHVLASYGRLAEVRKAVADA